MKLTDGQKRIVKEYGKYFHNTGGNNVMELAERTGITYSTNPIVCELQGCVWAQIHLLETLIQEDLISL